MIIIDVRTPEEYAQGHLEGAILIEYPYILRDINRYVDSIHSTVQRVFAQALLSIF